ncbi:MAG: 50S ribosomal protein L6 [candidate division Zixibacteria bacterium SM23_73_3]|nr:MAG: 50S ribosomal protein L6 [candidate division Zixibacteria bacterium SM23_73_3]
MSRVGKKPVTIPSGVKVKIKENQITVTGPKGELTQRIHPSMMVETAQDNLVIKRPSDNKFHRSLHGLTRSLVANMVAGVISEYQRTLEIQGIGYKAALFGKKLNLSLGLSHPVLFSPPEGVKITLDGPNKIKISGIDKQLVGVVAAKIRSFRPPEPYKGKGIRYEGEMVRKKAGKTAT